MMPLVDGDADEINDAVFGEVNYHAAYQPMRAIRTRRWKYIRRFYRRRIPVPPNQAPCDSRDIWDEQGWLGREEAREELYDLIFDPAESNNLAGDARHAAIEADLKERLHQWMRDTDDPLLRGHVPLIDGGSTVSWDELSNHGARMNADEWNAWMEANEKVCWRDKP
jgi:arylsulfatase A-like enzyme